MTYFFSALLVAVIATILYAVISPLLRGADPWESAAETELDRLLLEKNQVLRALKDLDRERAGGFIDDREHAETRTEYLEKAARLNRAIASLTGLDPAGRG